MEKDSPKETPANVSELKTELRDENFLAINYMLCYGNERLLDILIFGFSPSQEKNICWLLWLVVTEERLKLGLFI